MPILNRTSKTSHERVFERPRAAVEYDLWVCRAAVLMAAGHSERSAKARLATEMAVTPATVAEAVSHAAECHRALSGLLGRSNGTKPGARKVAA
jgi:hypothetical protein